MVSDFTSVTYSQCIAGFSHDSNRYRGERIKNFASNVKQTEQEKNVLGLTFSDFVCDQFSDRCQSSTEFLKTINYESIASGISSELLSQTLHVNI